MCRGPSRMDTVEEALARAPDALLTVFDALIKDRRDIPAPSPTKGPAIALPALESAKLALYDTLRTARVSKAELGRRLDWHPTQVDRLLALSHGSRLDQLDAAFRAVGKRLQFTVENTAASATPSRALSDGRGQIAGPQPRASEGDRRAGGGLDCPGAGAPGPRHAWRSSPASLAATPPSAGERCTGAGRGDHGRGQAAPAARSAGEVSGRRRCAWA